MLWFFAGISFCARMRRYSNAAIAQPTANREVTKENKSKKWAQRSQTLFTQPKPGGFENKLGTDLIKDLLVSIGLEQMNLGLDQMSL